jgi:hypothetical protein
MNISFSTPSCRQLLLVRKLSDTLGASAVDDDEEEEGRPSTSFLCRRASCSCTVGILASVSP